MQPANIALALRRRSPWEAIDLGLAMLQRWWRPVYGPHLLVGGALVALALAAAWATGRVWLALLLVWWCKPVYDRVVLHVLSRAVFGELPRMRSVLGAWREWLGTGIVMSLTLGRVDLARSFNLAVRQLEGQAGKAGRERKKLLGRRARGYAVWLGFVCAHFEWLVLYPSFGLLLALLAPAKAAEGQSVWQAMFGGGDEASAVLGYGDAAAYAATVLLLEPFYVAAGFALYLNRRTQLEGWDIEVALRRIAERHAAAALLLCAGLMLPVFGMDAYAQKNPQAEIREVLAAPEFGHYRDTERWTWRAPDWWPDFFGESKAKKSEGADLGALGYALAKAAELALWLAAAGALAYALWFIARMLPRAAAPRPAPYRPPAALFGMDLAPEKLPPDVAAAAAALAREGKLREALSLLYRGALSDLVHRRGVELRASHTELEVLGLSSQEVSLNFMKGLIDAWRESAYASRHPAAAEVERLAREYKAAFA